MGAILFNSQRNFKKIILFIISLDLAFSVEHSMVWFFLRGLPPTRHEKPIHEAGLQFYEEHSPAGQLQYILVYKMYQQISSRLPYNMQMRTYFSSCSPKYTRFPTKGRFCRKTVVFNRSSPKFGETIRNHRLRWWTSGGKDEWFPIALLLSLERT